MYESCATRNVSDVSNINSLVIHKPRVERTRDHLRQQLRNCMRRLYTSGDAMIFTNLARIVAWLALVFGALRLAIGYGIATRALGEYDAALARYAPGAANSGEVIDRGFYMIVFAIGLGTLAEISFNARRGRE